MLCRSDVLWVFDFAGDEGGGCGTVGCGCMNSSQQYLICVAEYLAEKGILGVVSLCDGTVGTSGGGDWRCQPWRLTERWHLSLILSKDE